MQVFKDNKSEENTQGRWEGTMHSAEVPACQLQLVDLDSTEVA